MVRLNVACIYKIRDAVEFASTMTDLNGQLYVAVQLAIRAIMNSVLVAEKTAQANVISRREELEYLERICEKENIMRPMEDLAH